MTPVERREEWALFEDYHCAHGSLMADWRRAWRTWCRQWKKFDMRGARRSSASGFAEIARRFKGEGDQ